VQTPTEQSVAAERSADAPNGDGLQQTVARAGFRVAVPNFEGPLELLLHLIREHKLDVFDIPIALITEKYLAYLDSMRAIDLDIAGEFLVMASTLLHLKSRMLLPKEEVTSEAAHGVETQVDASDPRADLVRRLLQYQKYKHAAEALAQNDLLDRDVYVRRVSVDEIPFEESEVGLREISIYKLIEALDRVLEKLNPKFQHEVTREHVSLSEAMRGLATQVLAADAEGLSFEALFLATVPTRSAVVITFLALLEMCKLKLLRVRQIDPTAPIVISASTGLSPWIIAADATSNEAFDQGKPRDDYR
jgi:segregation and condensation protein A